jgi:hypothetical protein
MVLIENHSVSPPPPRDAQTYSQVDLDRIGGLKRSLAPYASKESAVRGLEVDLKPRERANGLPDCGLGGGDMLVVSSMKQRIIGD